MARRSPPEVRVSAKARRYAEDNGGSLYLWIERRGSSRQGWLTVAAERPVGVNFGHVVDAKGLPVHVQAGMRSLFSRPVKVRLWRFPRVHIDVTGTVAVDPPAVTAHTVDSPPPIG
jgi:hypothetical protein